MNKIQRYVSYCKRFMFSGNKKLLLNKLFVSIKQYGVIKGIQIFLDYCCKVKQNNNKASKMNLDTHFLGEVICIGHDAGFYGAQILLLNIIKNFVLVNKVQVHLLLAGGGVLVDEYKKYVASITILGVDDFEAKVADLSNANIKYALANTVASGNVVEVLARHGIKTTTLVHELPWAIKNYNIEKAAKNSALHSNRLVFPASFVKNKFISSDYEINWSELLIKPQGLYNKNCYQDKPIEAYGEVRKNLGLNENDKIILGCGYGDFRKGVDLFCLVAQLFENTHIKFVWLGNVTDDMSKHISASCNVINVPSTADKNMYSKIMVASDVFFISSREDPFPSVVLDALSVGKPVIGFKNCGGFDELISNNGLGYLCDIENPDFLVEYIKKILSNEVEYQRIATLAIKVIERDYNFADYCLQLLDWLNISYFSVSVVVPNYNYARYLPLRLESIIKQTYPIKEIIILDDASNDDSLVVIQEFINNHLEFNIKLIVNKNNSGSVFQQWMSGIQLSSGDYIWIAEADDDCSPKFVQQLVNNLRANTVLAYSESKQIDGNSIVLAGSYRDYVKDISEHKWLISYHENGVQEIKEALCIKNTIPNVSAVIFKKLAVKPILDDLLKYKIAGDWLFYTMILESGDIYYHSESLNYHRRHEDSVTKVGFGKLIYDEIESMQTYLNNKYDISTYTKEIAKKYCNALIEQFCLK